MPHFKVNQKDIFFILKEQLNYASLCALERYEDLNEKALDMLVSEAISFARGALDPLQEIGEQWGVRLEDGQGHLSARISQGVQTIRAGRLDGCGQR